MARTRKYNNVAGKKVHVIRDASVYYDRMAKEFPIGTPVVCKTGYAKNTLSPYTGRMKAGGTVALCNSEYIVISFGAYRECFRWFDVWKGEVKRI